MTASPVASPPADAFRHTIRVRWGEVDAQGVVFNPNYFVYADLGATEYLRAAGAMTAAITDLHQSYVVDARATFRASARFDDQLDLIVWTDRLGRSSYDLRVNIVRGGQLLTEIYLTYVRAIDGASQPLSDEFRTLLGA